MLKLNRKTCITIHCENYVSPCLTVAPPQSRDGVLVSPGEGTAAPAEEPNQHDGTVSDCSTGESLKTEFYSSAHNIII